MNRDEMVEGIMRHAGISKANVARFYAGLVELVRRELTRNKEFVLPGLGGLRVRQRKARSGRNPQTGETIHIPAKKVVRFRAYRSLDELLNGPRKERPAEPQAPSEEAAGLWPKQDEGEAPRQDEGETPQADKTETPQQDEGETGRPNEPGS